MNSNSPEYISPEAFDAAVAIANQIYKARDAFHAAHTLADKLALKRDIARMQAARREVLGA